MRKIFLDIGGWNGASAEFFLKYHPESKFYEIFTFEPDRENIRYIKKKNLPITLIPKSAWSNNGIMKFYPGGAMKGSGGTMYSQKTTGNINPKKFYEVQTIDIAEFIKNNFIESDYIIMKMNCEGCEYEIIPHLQIRGLIPWMNKWFIQWHWEKLRMKQPDHLKISKLIPEFYEWDCQCHESSFKTKFLESL